MHQLTILIAINYFVGSTFATFYQLPCAAQKADDSVICICNSTYCDELYDDDVLASGTFRKYTTTMQGKRFEKSDGVLYDGIKYFEKGLFKSVVLTLNSDLTYEVVKGFGGAVTDSAAINWKKLSEKAQDYLIKSHFSDSGNKYNFVRLPIGGTDFSTHPYTYHQDVEDADLNHFDLTNEDYFLKMPMLRKISEHACQEVNIVATCWSPPGWMKTNGELTGVSLLKEEYYHTYALYHLKFLQAYADHGFKIWGITTTNEPNDGLSVFSAFLNCVGFPPILEAHWIANNLGPMIRNSNFKDIQILGCDDQRGSLPEWIDTMVMANSSVLDYLDGIAVHYYADKLVSATHLNTTHTTYPTKYILATEACTGAGEADPVKTGSWSRALSYGVDIIKDLQNWVTGWIEWNLCLDEKGGPTWVNNNVDSSIIVANNGSLFYKQPMYYMMGHFSKFITPGSKRVELSSDKESKILRIAFKRPDGNFVIVCINLGRQRNIEVRISSANRTLFTTVEKDSVHTFIISP